MLIMKIKFFQNNLFSRLKMCRHQIKRANKDKQNYNNFLNKLKRKFIKLK